MLESPQYMSADPAEQRISALVSRRFGIIMRARHAAKVCAALHDRAARQGQDLIHYIVELEAGGSREDKDHLIAQVTTNVTAFYREPHHFDSLRRHVMDLPKKRAVRCWSAGCSTGEEPWSALTTIAPLLNDEKRDLLLVLGTDIDAAALEKARTGLYPLKALDEIPLSARMHFEVSGENVMPHRNLRPLMRIRTLNLIEPFPFKAQFDAIFCRNTLIYFAPDQRQDVVRRLTARLRPGGLLMLGHSETLHHLPDGLEPAGLTTYRRVG